MSEIKITNPLGLPLNTDPDRLKKVISYANLIHVGHAVKQLEIKELFDGQIKKYTDRSLNIELSPESAARAKERMVYINFLPRIIDKLSRTYSRTITRTTQNELDAELMEDDVESMRLNQKLLLSNRLLRLHRCSALEPYIDGDLDANGEVIPGTGKLNLRVIPAHQFVCYSDSQINPQVPQFLIKFMPPAYKNFQPLLSPEVTPRLVNIFWIYTPTELIEVDNEGDVRTVRVNPLGKLPFVYINSSETELTPPADVESMKNAIQVTKALGDVGHGLSYQARSIIYGIDIEQPTGLTANPDSFWSIQGSPGDNKHPTIGVLKPQTDVTGSLAYATSIVDMWLITRNIKSGSVGTMTPSSAISGIAKIIDESDATSELEKDEVLYGGDGGVEDQLWELLALMRKTFRQSLADQRQYSEDPDFSVQFSDPAPLVDKMQNLQEMQLMRQLDAISQDRMLRILNPDLSDDELAAEKVLIASEAADKAALAQANAAAPAEGGPVPLTENKPKPGVSSAST
jgi:hypothetical protein